nr:hypothetical protein GCM10020092_033410 [Actinoplanes digitatis]
MPWWFNWDNSRYDNPIVLDANGDGRDDVLNPVNERDFSFCRGTLDTKCWANPRWTLALATGRRDAPFTVTTVTAANAHPSDGSATQTHLPVAGRGVRLRRRRS